jgi:two-component system sensor histidine kinase YesM
MKSGVSFVFTKIKSKIMDLKISTKIMLFYFILFLFTLLVSVLLYQRMYVSIMSDKINQVSMTTLYSINTNFNSTIENVNNYSRMIVANAYVRNVLKRDYDDKLKNTASIKGDIEEMNKEIKNLLAENPVISSVYLYDNYYNWYVIDKTGFSNNDVEGRPDKPTSLKSPAMSLKDPGRSIYNVPWYERVVDLKGAYTLLLNAGDVFNDTPDNNFISLIRLIRDIDSMKPIGIMIVNISDKAFVDLYQEILDKTDAEGAEIVLLDENNHAVVSNQNTEKLQINLLSKAENKEYDSRIINVDKKEYLQSYIRLGRYNWKFISMLPFDEISDETKDFYLITIIIILINGFILFIGSVIISRMITTPIKKLINSMKGIERKDFKMANIKTGNDEIGKLKDCYNIMVSEIQNLLHQTVEEQKIKRKAELNVLQAQIKPHFLYNTIDALGYLALAGRNEELYEALEALGSYYRTSLSKGKDIISIKKEVDIVKSYLTLQKLRYGDVFDVIYDVDEAAYEFETLKLILQPLVENAIYHGIKPKGEKGIIRISIKLEDTNIIMSVEDDGVGMSEEELLNVTRDKIDSNSTSFGLKGTIMRLQFFYGINDLYMIESKKRYGTRVTITIPKERGADNDRLLAEGYAG